MTHSLGGGTVANNVWARGAQGPRLRDQGFVQTDDEIWGLRGIWKTPDPALRGSFWGTGGRGGGGGGWPGCGAPHLPTRPSGHAH